MTDSNISGSSSRDGRSTEIERLVDELDAAAYDFGLMDADDDTDGAVWRTGKARVEAAHVALLKYLEDRTLTEPEAAAILCAVGREPAEDIYYTAHTSTGLEKLRLLAGSPFKEESK